ncbi:hypothetical protein SCHPADRAFT_553603 [Schizopora paradoxa]|uniref:WW domain-containing protein n=1 Tax=Schizopora paradoxa TaxID=27342 RepID=A0A0H2RCY8_9AGAM|nr:hypothetical protein SCHPADRAFT_553603 [Schizopora paradoxa]
MDAHRGRRLDSWMLDNSSSGGTFFDLSREILRLDEVATAFETSPPSNGYAFEVAAFPTKEMPARCIKPRIKNIKTCFPTRRNRYDRNIKRPKNHTTWEFRPMETLTIHDTHCDERWSPHTHPEGQLYFESMRRDGQFVYLTEDNLYERKNVDAIERFIEAFEKKAIDISLTIELPERMEVFSSLDEDNDEDSWHYYCVDTARRCIFWIDKIDLTWMAEVVGSVPTKAHLKYGLDYEYWIHVEHFPFHQTIPDDLIANVMGISIYYATDSMTSLDSTSPYGKEKALELVDLSKHLHDLKKTRYSHGYAVVAAARLMTVFVNEKFFHFAGQHGARLSRHQSIRGDKRKRTLFIRLISPFLFFAPEAHLSSLENIYVDGIVNSHPWMTYVTKLQEDWTQQVLFSAVLIAASVSFLAVPSVLPKSGIPPNQSAPPAVVATQVSLLLTLGGTIIGLLLSHEHRRKENRSAQAAADFLSRRSHRSRGLEALAILYSLPFSLLMWGMLSFLTSIGITCLNLSVNGLAPTIICAISFGLVLLTIVCTVLTQVEPHVKSMSMRFMDFVLPSWLSRKPHVEGLEEIAEGDCRSLTTDSESITSDWVLRRKPHDSCSV